MLDGASLGGDKGLAVDDLAEVETGKHGIEAEVLDGASLGGDMGLAVDDLAEVEIEDADLALLDFLDTGAIEDETPCEEDEEEGEEGLLDFL